MIANRALRRRAIVSALALPVVAALPRWVAAQVPTQSKIIVGFDERFRYPIPRL